MNTLAIPPRRVRLYRTLWDRWIIVLRLMFDLGAGAHPVRWRAVADTLLIDKKTCQKYIAGLVRDGHLAIAGEGYTLTEAGMGFLAETDDGENPHLVGKISGENFSPLKESVVVVSELKTLTPTTPTESGKNPGENFSPQPDVPFFDPDVRTAIENIPLLLDGAEVTFKGLAYYLHIEKVMGWIAYVYDRQSQMNKPAGVLYSKLADQTSPSPSVKYMKDPYKYLPDDYLNAIGKYEKTCDLCKKTFTDLAAFEAHQEPCLYTPREEPEDPAILFEPDKTVSDDLLKAWEKVIAQLEMDMPRASFETWVRDIFPGHCTGDEVQIVTRNAYAKDWLASRLTETVQQGLSGALKRTVTVRFVVAMETAEA